MSKQAKTKELRKQVAAALRRQLVATLRREMGARVVPTKHYHRVTKDGKTLANIFPTRRLRLDILTGPHKQIEPAYVESEADIPQVVAAIRQAQEGRP